MIWVFLSMSLTSLVCSNVSEEVRHSAPCSTSLIELQELPRRGRVCNLFLNSSDSRCFLRFSSFTHVPPENLYSFANTSLKSMNKKNRMGQRSQATKTPAQNSSHLSNPLIRFEPQQYREYKPSYKVNIYALNELTEIEEFANRHVEEAVKVSARIHAHVGQITGHSQSLGKDPCSWQLAGHSQSLGKDSSSCRAASRAQSESGQGSMLMIHAHVGQLAGHSQSLGKDPSSCRAASRAQSESGVWTRIHAHVGQLAGHSQSLGKDSSSCRAASRAQSESRQGSMLILKILPIPGVERASLAKFRASFVAVSDEHHQVYVGVHSESSSATGLKID
ncbi:hypothetical protein RRG08_037601 [Elysia crispata]|uniref:Uncharacterized protein n=1 Tax=Elysia crispata TaxID=231223 RepID=A0AAE0YGI7_9GAST|nr:hypothetical protein RRG08_037601 [Elysia crispata]